MAVISEKSIQLVNYRIEQEQNSGYLYKAIAICMEYKGYEGTAALFYKYAEEEFKHAGKSYEYLLNLDVRPEVPTIQSPPPEFEGIVEVCNIAYKHEIEITGQCSELAKHASEEGDYMLLDLAQWYLREQNEEIRKVTDLLNYIEVLGGESITNDGKWLLDKKLGEIANK